MQDTAATRDDHWPGKASRPQSIAELMTRLPWFRSAASTEHSATLQARSSDVFVATYPKCGTTWTQQIVHTLRSDGDMSFGEITEAVPWFESAHDIHVDINAEQLAPPRVFKTHSLYSDLPGEARHIYITRDPARVAVSFYRFLDGWMLQAGCVDLDTFIRDMYLSGSRSGTWWGHLLEWWPLRNAENVLFLSYEDMLKNPRDAIKAIAYFCDIPLTPGLLSKTLEHSGIEFMRTHHEKFNDHIVRSFRDPAMGFPEGGASDKVSRSGSADTYRLSPDSVKRLEDRWNETIHAELGFANYAELRSAIGGVPTHPDPVDALRNV